MACVVFQQNSEAQFAQVDELLHADRVDAYDPADYTTHSTTAMWLRLHVKKIANRILAEREKALHSRRGSSPKHLAEQAQSTISRECGTALSAVFFVIL